MKTYVRDERYKHIVKQWIALNVCSDWLLRLQIFFAIHLRATHTRLVHENIIIVAGINV